MSRRVMFENIRNKEKFYCTNPNDTMIIEGDVYIKVFRMENNRECFIRKDNLRKVVEVKNK